MDLEKGSGQYAIDISEDAEIAKEIHRDLVKYVESHVGPSTFRELSVVIKNDRGERIAGLNGQSNWQWLFVKMVYVNDEHRYRGLGSHLLKAAELEARRRGCRGVWLDTFSFQSPDFYKKHGYQQFGELLDYPFGHRRHFFFKRLG